MNNLFAILSRSEVPSDSNSEIKEEPVDPVVTENDTKAETTNDGNDSDVQVFLNLFFGMD
jgi:hypothetical protein